TGTLKITPLKGWNINADYTYNVYNLGKKYHGKEIIEHYANPDVTTIFPHITPSSVEFTSDEDYYQTVNIFSDFEYSQGRHNFKILAGFNWERKDYRWFNAKREDLISPDIAGLGMASGEKYNGSGEHSWATTGYFARINYNFDNRYLLELNGRYDGSSKFPKNNRFTFFPSFSTGWRISQENFFESARQYVDELKLRASYGTLGNQSVGGDYPYIATMGANGEMGYLIDGKKIACITAPGLVSPLLTWEKVHQLDFGIDFQALNSRLYGTFDWYQRITKDMVTTGLPLPAVLGTGAPQANTADLRTNGWELNIGWRDRLGCGLSYDVSLVLSDYRAEITKFNNPEKIIGSHYAGEIIGEIWGFETEGLFQSEEEVRN
ncbi:MAG: TonB-dependent receptor, partial [Muribaculaceae bacterium]|nr:TonB-dependent receptor [Muribaculaceae bacterium]